MKGEKSRWKFEGGWKIMWVWKGTPRVGLMREGRMEW